MKKLFSLLVLIICSTWVSAQYNGIDMLNGKKKLEIPISYSNGFILLEVQYGEFLPLKFLLDTGASHNILFKKTINDLLKYSYTDTITVQGSDLNQELTAMVSRGIPMKVGNGASIVRDIIVLAEDYVELEKVLGERVDGILGGDFLKGLVVEINYKKQKLTLYNPNLYKPNPKFYKDSISITSFKPYLKVKTKINQEEKQLNFLIDTGASLALLVHANKSNIEIPENSIIGTLGKGLGGDILGFIGQVNSIHIGGKEIKGIITSFQNLDSILVAEENLVRDGLLGNIILSRFTIILDYVHGLVYLKPNKDINDEFKYDKSGLSIYASGKDFDEFYISHVFPDTPAEEAGLLPGDRITKIGFWPLRFYTLEDITSKLQGKENKKIKISILRNNKKLKFEFRLRDRFHKKSTIPK